MCAGIFSADRGVTVVINVLVFVFIIRFTDTADTAEILEMSHEYVKIIFAGIFFVFLYNYYAYL